MPIAPDLPRRVLLAVQPKPERNAMRKRHTTRRQTAQAGQFDAVLKRSLPPKGFPQKYQITEHPASNI